MDMFEMLSDKEKLIEENKTLKKNIQELDRTRRCLEIKVNKLETKNNFLNQGINRISQVLIHEGEPFRKGKVENNEYNKGLQTCLDLIIEMFNDLLDKDIPPTVITKAYKIYFNEDFDKGGK